MICKYSYLFKRRKPMEFNSRYYTVQFAESGEYECDMEDFKKMFSYLKKDIVALVLKLGDGSVWVWQNKVGFKGEPRWAQIKKPFPGYRVERVRQNMCKSDFIEKILTEPPLFAF